MKNLSILLLVAAVSFLAGAGLTYFTTRVSWISDMANQPSVKPQEHPLDPPRRSVPMDWGKGGWAEPKIEKAPEPRPAESMGQGHEHLHTEKAGHRHRAEEEPRGGHAHGPEARQSPAKGRGHSHSSEEKQAGGHSHEPRAGHAHMNEPTAHGQMGHHGHDSEMGHGPEMRNPVEATPASIKQGRELFGIYCAVCHGPEGKGGMPIAAKYPKIPRFNARLLKDLSDSHFYDMVTNGHGPMPGYAEALAPAERWNVANYLRSLQEK